MSKLFTQVNCVADGKVLMMRRNKEPNFGSWVVPGGKVERDEAPYECAVRELKEETGLTAHVTELRGVVSLVMPKLTAPMIHFLYLVPYFSGDLLADKREGDLAWHEIEHVSDLAMSQANAVFLPHVLNQNEIFYQAKYVYDAEWQLLEVVENDLKTRN